ncbi:MAG: hypothetical protein RMH84_05595, partial [Sulfolobales archaeon]|nr:hypothetical protein [Sulfolobales archaeon]MDW8011050.1 hypothetical protein [Sulfolobales archaeon]
NSLLSATYGTRGRWITPITSFLPSTAPARVAVLGKLISSARDFRSSEPRGGGFVRLEKECFSIEMHR